jgi:hypothetical protein
LGVRWYVFGAQAVQIWGRPRLTADVDLTVEVAPDGVPALIAAVEGRGFALRVRKDVDAFVARTRVLPFAHEATGIGLDVVLAGPGFEEGFLERAVRVPLGEATVPVISPEDLVITKVLAGRPKDVEDVRGVLAERAERLDLGYVRDMLGQLESALGQSDLLPLLESELKRVEGRT